MRTRESLSDLIEGRLSSAGGRAGLMKLATRLIIEEALEAETACFMDDFEACIAHRRIPITHRRAIRTANLLVFRPKRKIPNGWS